VIQILIVDDCEHIRRMVRGVLRAHEGWAVCGEACNGREAINQCEILKPKLIVLNMHMPVTNGLDAARQIFIGFPGMLILILTLDVSAHFALAAANCGAQGLLMKSLATDHLVTAVTTLLQGDRYFPAYAESTNAATL
jgi:DNA-binding NarL/FixJ family response regulator